MALWNKLRTELDRAGRVAQDALDEGKLRLEIFRARQLVDRAAQSLGYAVYRARTGKETPDDSAMVRLVDAVRAREEVMNVLLTSTSDRDMFRKVYPFSPALIQVLVAVSSVLQREPCSQMLSRSQSNTGAKSPRPMRASRSGMARRIAANHCAAYIAPSE